LANKILVFDKLAYDPAANQFFQLILIDGGTSYNMYVKDVPAPVNPGLASAISSSGAIPVIAPSGAGDVVGLGTTGTLPLWTNGPGSVIGDSVLTQVGGNLIQPTGNLTLTLGNLVLGAGVITFPDNVRQTFNPGLTTPGVNVGSNAGDPTTPANGDIWYDSTGNLLRARINGATVTLGASVATPPAGNPNNIQFNLAGAFGANANFNFDNATGNFTLPGFTWTGSPQTLALSSAADQIPLTVASSNSLTNSVNLLLDLQETQAGAAAAGFGAQVRIGLKSSTTANQDAVLINGSWSTATHASRTSVLDFNVVGNAVTVNVLKITAVGAGTPSTGLQITSNAAAAGVTLTAIGGGTDEMINLVPKGAGAVEMPKNGGIGFSVHVSGQNPVGFGRNASVGGMNLYGGGATPSDTNAEANITNNVLLLQSAVRFGWSLSNVTQNMDSGFSRIAAGVIGVGTGSLASRAGWLQWSGEARQTADATKTDTTFASLTDLTISNIISGRKYFGRLVIKCNNSTAAEGIKFDFNGGSATVSAFWAVGSVSAGGTTVLGTVISTSLAGVINFTTITGETLIVIDFSFVASGNGTLIPRFAENSTAAGTATVELGSFQWVQDCP